MTKIDGIEFVASEKMLIDAAGQEALPEPLLAPMQALIHHVMDASASKPFAIYLMSSDAVRSVRDYFAHALARLLCRQEPSAVIVDCDFTAAGMSGVIPQRDALGFLDYLLYGSSLGVVAQEAAQGVRVIGAGSFPVSKKMPVSMDSFADAARRLVAQCRIVIFCGPDRDDNENIHPICEAADLLMNVSYEKRFPVGRVDPFEEKLARISNSPVISVRVTSSDVGMETATEPAPEAVSERPVHEQVPSVEDRLEPAPQEAEEEVTSVPRAEPAASDGRKRSEWMEEEAPHSTTFSGLPFERKQTSSIWAKIIPAVIAIALIGFLFWWFIITKPMRGTEGEAQLAAVDSTEAAGVPPATGEAVSREMGEAADGSDSISAQPGQSDSIVSEERAEGAGPVDGQISDAGRPDEVKEEEAAAPSEEMGSRRTRPEGEAAREDISPDDVYVAADFTEFAGKYLVHVSSFREIGRAREDAAYLMRNNFAACVIPVDLNSKGIWYRVYAGPIETRDKALQQKIMLDELPRVKFTRITQAPSL
jgi:cell division septation protein DedD